MQNYIKNKIKSGGNVVGIWSILASPVISEIVAASGFDFQILDLEHGLFDFGSLENSIKSSELLGCSPLVRMGDLNPANVQKVLDMGAHGLIFPQIKIAADSKKAVETCLFPPNGVRGYNPFTRANAYGFNDKAALHRNIADFALTGVIIENISAQQNLDDILKTEKLDIVYLGAYDMSVSLGKPGDMSNPELINFLHESVKKIRNQGKTAGVMVKTVAEVELFTKIGANFIVLGVDSYLIGSNLKQLRENSLISMSSKS